MSTNTGASGRRDSRYRVRMSVELQLGKRTAKLQTGDVGLRGVFLRTDEPPAENEFVRLSFLVPGQGERLVLHGRVAHVHAVGKSMIPGVGVSFYGNGKDELDRWAAFVQAVVQQHPDATERDVWLDDEAPGGASGPINRRYRRFEATVHVRAYFADVDELVAMHTTDVSQGGMFIATAVNLDVGATMALVVVHPKSGAEFPIDCVVRRRVADPERQGLAVEFRMDEVGRRRFWDFIGAEVKTQAENAPAKTLPPPLPLRRKTA